MLWLWCVTWHSMTNVTSLWLCDCHVIFPILHLSNNLKKRKEKEKKYKYWLSYFAKLRYLSPNIWNIWLSLLLSLSLAIWLILFLSHFVSYYLLIFQIYSKVFLFFPFLSCSYNYGLDAQTSYIPNILFCTSSLVVPLIKQGLAFFWAGYSWVGCIIVETLCWYLKVWN